MILTAVPLGGGASLWNTEVARGEREVPPFQPKPVPAFRQVRIENQEILQEQGGAGAAE